MQLVKDTRVSLPLTEVPKFGSLAVEFLLGFLHLKKRPSRFQFFPFEKIVIVMDCSLLILCILSTNYVLSHQRYHF